VTTSPDTVSKSEKRQALQAALYLVRKLQIVASKRVRSSDLMTEDDLDQLRAEIGMALRLLSFEEAFGPILTTIDAFLSPPKESASAAPVKSWGAASEYLDMLERAIETRMVDFGSEIADASGAGVSGHEDSLVGRATTAFLGSPAFKLLVVAIAVAVGLAGTGSLIIAGQTYYTSRDVRSIADSATKNINDLVTTARATADQQTKLYATAERAIADAKGKFDLTIAETTTRVNDQAVAVQNQASRTRDELASFKQNAIDEVVKKIRADLDEDSKPLRKRLEEAANEAAKNLTNLSTTALAPLNARIDELSRKLGEDERKQASLTASLKDLDEWARRINEIQKAVDKAGSYAEAAEDAHLAAIRAEEAAANAQTHREAVFKLLQSLHQDIGAQLTRFGETRSKFDDLVRQVSALRPEICDQPALDSSPWAAQAQLVCIKQRIAALETRFASSPIKPKTEEPPLSKGEWKSVQRALKTEGFYHRGIDGDPGEGTRSGIRDWQRKIGEEITGKLTEAQVARLLSVAQNAR
jgi:hypothetical protein